MAFLIAQLVKNLSAMQEILVRMLGGEDLLEKGLGYSLQYSRASLLAQLVNSPPAMQCGRPGFDPWVRKIPWRREQLPTPVFWPGEFHKLLVHGVIKSQTCLSHFHLQI